jgi:hypothetical protein
MSENFYGVEAIGEVTIGRNFSRVFPVKNYCKEVENDLGVSFDNKLMVDIILCEMNTFSKTPYLHNIIVIMPNAPKKYESDASLDFAEHHSKTGRTWITFGFSIKV